MRIRTVGTAATVVAGVVMAFAVPTAIAGSGPVTTATGAPAADGCFTWSGSLSEGASGDEVRNLQIRVAGYPGEGEQLAIDGEFGPATTAAVTRFQEAYGLPADGVADSDDYDKLYELQDDDCSPVDFDFTELNTCNSDWSGGAVPADEAKDNALVTMWKLQAMRHAMGDEPIVVNGGFRSEACNDDVGGSPTSRHLYGDAADLGAGSQGFCELALQARGHGFGEILGPGYPGHDDHTHVAGGADTWSAPDCGL